MYHNYTNKLLSKFNKPSNPISNSEKNSITKSYMNKHSLDYMTLNHHAALSKRKFLIAMCLRDIDNEPIYSEHDFWTSDSTILEQVKFLKKKLKKQRIPP